MDDEFFFFFKSLERVEIMENVQLVRLANKQIPSLALASATEWRRKGGRPPCGKQSGLVLEETDDRDPGVTGLWLLGTETTPHYLCFHVVR